MKLLKNSLNDLMISLKLLFILHWFYLSSQIEYLFVIILIRNHIHTILSVNNNLHVSTLYIHLLSGARVAQ